MVARIDDLDLYGNGGSSHLVSTHRSIVVIFQDVDLDKEALENLLDMVEEMKKRATSKSQLTHRLFL